MMTRRWGPWKTLASKLRDIGFVVEHRHLESPKEFVCLLVESGGGGASPQKW